MPMNDLEIYTRQAADWWDESSITFRSLRSVTAYRLSLIDRWLGDLGQRKVIDLGCGGGLLLEPLLARGTSAIGVDISGASLQALSRHCLSRHRQAAVVQANIVAAPFAAASFDVALLADVLEHLPNYEAAIHEAARLLRPGGYLYVSTINRNRLSAFLVITLSESVLRLIPKNTHDPRLFIPPEDLRRIGRSAGLQQRALQGEAPAILSTLARRAIVLKDSRSVRVAYSALFQKDAA